MNLLFVIFILILVIFGLCTGLYFSLRRTLKLTKRVKSLEGSLSRVLSQMGKENKIDEELKNAKEKYQNETGQKLSDSFHAAIDELRNGENKD